MINGGMQYLNQFIKELTRKYPSLPFLDRECFPPPGETNYSLEPYSSFKIPVGMPVYIPMYAIHHDPQVNAEDSSGIFLISKISLHSFTRNQTNSVRNASIRKMLPTMNIPTFHLE